MKNLKIIFLLTFLIFSLQTYSQRGKPHNKSRLIISIGGTELMGDLGGGADEAKHFLGFQDVNLKATRFTYRLGYEYRIIKELSIMADVGYAKLFATDSLSKNEFRNNRNLHSLTTIGYTTTQFRYYFIREKPMGRNPKDIYLFQRFSAYVLFGGGITLYKPQARYENEWHSLRKLNTEGQGLGEENSYKIFTFIVPIGFGFKFYLDHEFAIGLELINNYTFTDYLDDVHGDYYDNNAIRSNYGDMAAELADRRIDKSIGSKNNINERGNQQYKDSYFFLMLNVTFHLWK